MERSETSPTRPIIQKCADQSVEDHRCLRLRRQLDAVSVCHRWLSKQRYVRFASRTAAQNKHAKSNHKNTEKSTRGARKKTSPSFFFFLFSSTTSATTTEQDRVPALLPPLTALLTAASRLHSPLVGSSSRSSPGRSIASTAMLSRFASPPLMPRRDSSPTVVSKTPASRRACVYVRGKRGCSVCVRESERDVVDSTEAVRVCLRYSVRTEQAAPSCCGVSECAPPGP